MGFALIANMNIAVLRNEPVIVQKFAEQTVTFASQFGFPEFIAMGRIARGWATAKLGQHSTGLEDLEAGFELWKMTGFENWQSWFTSLKSEILILMNRDTEAREDIQSQLRRIERNREMQFKPQLLAQLEQLDWATDTD